MQERRERLQRLILDPLVDGSKEPTLTEDEEALLSALKKFDGFIYSEGQAGGAQDLQ